MNNSARRGSNSFGAPAGARSQGPEALDSRGLLQPLCTWGGGCGSALGTIFLAGSLGQGGRLDDVNELRLERRAAHLQPVGEAAGDAKVTSGIDAQRQPSLTATRRRCRPRQVHAPQQSPAQPTRKPSMSGRAARSPQLAAVTAARGAGGVGRMERSQASVARGSESLRGDPGRQPKTRHTQIHGRSTREHPQRDQGRQAHQSRRR